MSDERVMISGRVSPELKEEVNRDPRDNQDVLQDALERELATKEEAAVLRRLDEIDREITELKGQKNERERKIDEKEDEKERLQKSLKQMEQSQERHKETVLEKAEKMPADPEHPFVIDHADTLDMDPQELAAEIAEYHGKELQENDDTDEFRSL